VVFGLIVKSFDELHTLPFLAEVVTVFAVIFSVIAEVEQSVVIDRHAAVAVKHSAYPAVTPKNHSRQPRPCDKQQANPDFESLSLHGVHRAIAAHPALQ
jgi:hypothetical protein